MTYSAIFLIAFILIIGIYTLFCLPRTGWRKWASLIIVPMLSFGTLGTYVVNLGKPVPIQIESMFTHKMIVVGYQFHENVAIYLWVYTEGSTMPISVTLPWSTETAKKVMKNQYQVLDSEGTKQFVYIVKRNGLHVQDDMYVEETIKELPAKPVEQLNNGDQ